MKEPPPGLAQARWIWLDQKRSRPNQFVCFRKSFTLARLPRRATLDLSVDSNFHLYVNGEEIGCGQFSDWPRDKTYTRYEVASKLRRGRNVIAIATHYIGRTFSCYCKGRPGLIAALTAGDRCVVSDATWRAVEHPAYRQGPMPHVTPQLSFTWAFDARRDIPWSQLRCADGRWKHARELAGATDGYWRALKPRPVPALEIGDPAPVHLTAQGWLHRHRPGRTPADTMNDDALVSDLPAQVFALPDMIDEHNYQGPPINPGHELHGKSTLIIRPPRRGADGTFVIIDLGREEVGLFEMGIEAPRGAVVDIAYGEHLDDGRVRARIGKRHFADRYTCGSGAHRFLMPFRRLGARFLQLHFTGYRSNITLTYAGVRPTHVPLKRRGAFRCPDPLATSVHETALRTLDLCMHEHYEDCPWREQSLYAYDSRNQALFGYYAFGNHDFAAASFDLLGRGLRDDGLLELCAPAIVPVNIPIFSFVWILAVADHYLFTGRPTLFDRFADAVRTILGTAIERPDPSGLYRMPTGDDIWQFYEWTPGLVDMDRGRVAAREHHAGYNLYLHAGLRAWADMLSWKGEAGAARDLRQRCRRLATAIHRRFWQADQNQYATRLVRGNPRQAHEHIQGLALHESVVPAAARRRVLARIYEQSMPVMTLSSLLYLVDALMPIDPTSRCFISGLISRYWDRMSLTGATTFWETQFAGDDFNYAGSLCHGWSALPAYYYQAYVLGIRPIEPGFEKFVISPYPDRFHEAEGAVPTPKGPIRIAWARSDRGLRVTCRGPSGLRPTLQRLPEVPIAGVTYNGRTLRS